MKNEQKSTFSWYQQEMLGCLLSIFYFILNKWNSIASLSNFELQ